MGKRKGNQHSEKDTQAKNIQAPKKHDLRSNGLKGAFFHTLSNGWVQNSSVGFLFVCAALVAAIMTNTQVRSAAIIFGIAGTVALWIWVAALIRYVPEEKPPFAVTIETSFVGSHRDATQIFCQHGEFLSPIPISLFIRLVNLQDVPSDISQFKIEVELKKRWWMLLSMAWLRTEKIPEYMPLIWVNQPPTTSMRMNFTGGFLVPVLENRPLQPHQTLRGWVLLDVPKNFDSALFPRIFRISVKDTTGHKITVLDSGPTGEQNVTSHHGFQTTEPVDITGFQINHLADYSN